jgi:hypothetical protein
MRTDDEATMDIWRGLRFFSPGPVEPPSARKLGAGSESALVASIEGCILESGPDHV